MKVTIENQNSPRKIKARDLQVGQLGKVLTTSSGLSAGELLLCHNGTYRSLINLNRPEIVMCNCGSIDQSVEVEVLENKQIVLQV